MQENETPYLSPELMKALRSEEVSPEYDAIKADVYSLGVTLLEAISLQPPINAFYDYN